jgi:hypothetical protein
MRTKAEGGIHPALAAVIALVILVVFVIAFATSHHDEPAPAPRCVEAVPA